MDLISMKALWCHSVIIIIWLENVPVILLKIWFTPLCLHHFPWLSYYVYICLSTLTACVCGRCARGVLVVPLSNTRDRPPVCVRHVLSGVRRSLCDVPTRRALRRTRALAQFSTTTGRILKSSQISIYFVQACWSLYVLLYLFILGWVNSRGVFCVGHPRTKRSQI